MFTNGENLHAKISPTDFKVTTPENSLLSQQAVTSKGIQLQAINMQLYVAAQTNHQLTKVHSGKKLTW